MNCNLPLMPSNSFHSLFLVFLKHSFLSILEGNLFHFLFLVFLKQFISFSFPSILEAIHFLLFS